MAITPEDVKKLRQKTDAGMLDCKKALEEAGGDFTKAERILKEKGLASAGKRMDRATSEGGSFVVIHPDKAVILEIGCETDFVSKTDQFKALGQALGQTIIEKNLTQTNDDLLLPLKEAVAVLKENLILKRFQVLPLAPDETVAHYLHNGGQIGVLIKAKVSDGKKDDTNIKTFLVDCAMHCAAMSPSYLSRSHVAATYIEEQQGIFEKKTQIDEKTASKPENVRKNIAQGMLSKHLAEICLMEQAFVKDPALTVEKKMQAIAKDAGCSLEITDFVCYRVGVE
ncbi:MAG: translation elongation factor Ts [Spirochaetia bacterium]